MKNIILALLFIAFSTTMYAQKPKIEQFKDHRTETYAFKRGKGDSLRYVIHGKDDTTQTIVFYRSGKPSDIIWKDSLYIYSEMGLVVTKKFGFSSPGKTPDSIVFFYPTGRFRSVKTEKNGIINRVNFTETGEVQSKYFSKTAPSVYWTCETFFDGTPRESKRRDTSLVDKEEYVRLYDTLFYGNGQPFNITHREGKEKKQSDYTMTKYFNKDGTLIESILPDSLILSPFKDNVDCYYGLKNEKGDTIVRPSFDHVSVQRNENLIKTYIGDVCTLYNLDGSKLTQPVKNLRNIGILSKVNASINYDYSFVNDVSKSRIEEMAKQRMQKYFAFVDSDHKYGIVDKNQNIVIAAQPLILGGSYIGEGQFFPFVEKLGDSLIRRGYLNRRGKPILPDYFKYVYYANYEDYFLISKANTSSSYTYKPVMLGSLQDKLVGLAKGSDETMILQPNYEKIGFLPSVGLFVVELPDAKEKGESIQGLYNPRTKKWLLETKDSRIANTGFGSSFLYFVVKNVKTKKYSIMDTTGRFVVTTSLGLDSVGVVDNKKGRFWVKKKNKFHLLEIINGRAQMHPTGYEYLDYMTMGTNLDEKGENFYCFLAKRNGKWGAIDFKETIIKPFEYDYGADGYDRNSYNTGFFLVKNDKASYFEMSSLPNETPDLPNINNEDEAKKKAIYTFKTADNADCLFFINDTGKVMIPPQYKKVENHENDSDTEFQVVEDPQKRKKLIFQETGQILDMPFRYDVHLADIKSRIMIVSDTTEASFGVVSTSGKELIPCINYSIAIGDLEKSVFFVKRDTPNIQRFTDDYSYGYLAINRDSLNAEDKDWIMFDGDGKQLDANSFRFPIAFVDGIGVGMQGEDFNLYKPDGSILLPFDKEKKLPVERNFNNIRRMKSNNFYVLYRNQGLTPTMMLTKPDGEIVVESGRYDGISAFNGAYAYVSSLGQVGLIDSFGREIVAPQDLRTTKIALIDSLNKNKTFLFSYAASRHDSFPSEEQLPFAFHTVDYEMHADSLKISAEQRMTLLNLMFEKALPMVIQKANTVRIPRSTLKRSASFFQEEYSSSEQSVSLKRLAIAENSLAFAWSNSELYAVDFYNFKKINGRWEEKNLFDILDLQGDKRWALNDLVTKKVKALKDETIDCSNSGAFIAQVERRFMLTEKGIDFCFESENRSSELVIIPCTWAELGPFLKK